MSRTRSALILEIDGDCWSAVVTEFDKRTIRVLDGSYGALAPPGQGLDVDGIVDWIVDHGHTNVPVHIVAHRRELRLTEVEVPRQTARELQDALLAAGRQACDLPPDAEVWVGHRVIQKEKLSIRYSLLVLPRQGPINALVTRDELTVRSLVTVEDALLNVLPETVPESVMLVDFGPRVLRLACIEDGVVRHLRRAHHDTPAGRRLSDVRAMEDRLGFELQLTLDYFGCGLEGIELPETLVCAPALAETEILGRVAVDCMPLIPETNVEPGPGRPGRHQPALASIGLARFLCNGQGDLMPIAFGKAGTAAVTDASGESDAETAGPPKAAPRAAPKPEPKAASTIPKQDGKRSAPANTPIMPLRARRAGDDPIPVAEPAPQRAASRPLREKLAQRHMRPAAVVITVALLLVLAGIVVQPVWFGDWGGGSSSVPSTAVTTKTDVTDGASPAPPVERPTAIEMHEPVSEDSEPAHTPDTTQAATHDTPAGPVDRASETLTTYPASLLIMEACNRAPDGLLLEEVDFDESQVMIRGRIVVQDGKDGLDIFDRYRDAIADLPFLVDVTESVQYRNPSDGSLDLAFRLHARWNR